MTDDRTRRITRTGTTVRTTQLVGAALLLGLFASGCTSGTGTTVRILSYNVHNLFDDIDDGREYAAFRSAAGWDRHAYYRRLERLDEAVRLVAAGRRLDVVTLQEVESAKVAADFARDFLRGHRFISAGPAGVSNTKVVVLSRRRPSRVLAHRVAEFQLVPDRQGPPASTRPPGRDAVDVTFDVPPLRVIAVHWKSQSGGAAVTEPLRSLEAALIHDALLDSSAGQVLLVGDLNADPDQYRRHGMAWPTAIMRLEDLADATERFGDLRPGIRYTSDSAAPRPAGSLVFRSLWTGVDYPGTYRFRGEWSRLDQAFLLAPDSWTGSLSVGAFPELTDATGGPWAYTPGTRRGYSDHYPILVTLTTGRAR